MRYRLSRRAEQDLIEILQASLRHFGARQTDRYQQGFENAFSLIAAFPGMARERRELNPPARVHPCGAHLVLYIVDEQGILIVRLRHGREDWMQVTPEDG